MLAFALLGYFFLAIVFVLDKHILSQTPVRPLLYTFYSTIFILPVLLLYFFGAQPPAGVTDWGITIMAGGGFMLALLTMFIAMRQSEVSHVGPLIGAATPLFVALLAHLFLAEALASRQYYGINVLIIGSAVIAFEKSRLHNGLHRGVLWGLLAALLFAVSHVASKYLYDSYGFFSGFVFSRAAAGAAGALLLLVPGLWQQLLAPGAAAGPSPAAGSRRWRRGLALVGIDKILGIAAVVLIQYASSLGSVSVVNALSGVQFALLVIIVALLSHFYPRIFKEEYRGRELLQELAGVGCIAIGLMLVV